LFIKNSREVIFATFYLSDEYLLITCSFSRSFGRVKAGAGRS